MVSGSAVANVAVNGAISIPLMKRSGYSGHMAAAIEAVASTGGQIMPPVMGAAAFLMAEFLNISYGQVALAAAIPACLYYLALFVQVDLEAAKKGLAGMPAEQVPRLRNVMRRGWVFLIPLAVLVFGLMIADWDAGHAGMAAVITVFAVGALQNETAADARTASPRGRRDRPHDARYRGDHRARRRRNRRAPAFRRSPSSSRCCW
jgi:TRAP-type uncharacterized transport system fused permease subunit